MVWHALSEKKITFMEGPLSFLERVEVVVGAARVEVRKRGRRARRVVGLYILKDLRRCCFKLEREVLNRV